MCDCPHLPATRVAAHQSIILLRKSSRVGDFHREPYSQQQGQTAIPAHHLAPQVRVEEPQSPQQYVVWLGGNTFCIVRTWFEGLRWCWAA